MKITELKDKIIIAELDPDCDYICLVNPALLVNEADFLEIKSPTKKEIPIVYVRDVHKAVSFVEVHGQEDESEAN